MVSDVRDTLADASGSLTAAAGTRSSRRVGIYMIVLFLGLLWPAMGYGALAVKPYRVLILADARVRDGYVLRDAGELGDAVALLSLWGVPHDVLRLDTQALREQDLVDASGQPLYGVILWTVRSDLLPRRFQEDAVLRDACLKHHISLIAFGDRIDAPSVQEILGLRDLGSRQYAPPLALGDAPHFITRGESSLPHLADEPWCSEGPAVRPTDPDVHVLLRAGDQPLATARTLDAASGTRAIWLGGNAESLLYGGTGLGIRLFQRSLVYALGAIVVHDYYNTLMLRMDDPGTSQSSYLHGWNYPTLSESLVRQKILAPLREHHASLDVFCCPGYVDAKAHRILHAEQVDQVDVFGEREDVRDTFAAFLEGQKDGLIEIASHGWTHFDPDLDTPIPGSTNWWSGTPTTEWANYHWYREFYDRRRGREVPAEIQLQHMRTSCDWLESYFGHRPISFCPPGHAISGDSWVYSKKMTGTVDVKMEGADPGAAYRVLLGEDPDWLVIGDLRADAKGAISASLPAPPQLWLEGRGYFTINKVGGRTHFVAGPIDEALGFDFTLPVRGRAQMKAVERQEFTDASPLPCHGRITGRLNKDTYQPPSRPATSTHKIAAAAGFGLMIDTECHDLDGDQVTTLRMLPVVSSPKGIEPAVSCQDDVPTVFRFHNRDLILNADYLVHILNSLDEQGPPPTYISADELAGYLHAYWTISASGNNRLTATMDASPAACRYLREHGSTWSLVADDEVMAALGGASGKLVIRAEGESGQPVAAVRGRTGAIQLHVPAGRDGYTMTLHAE